MRLVVTGLQGQVVSALKEKAAQRGDIDLVLLGRPDLDLAEPARIEAAVMAARPDAIISAAAYTAVDRAEGEEALALAINGVAPGHLARAADRLGVPIVQLSTDYVFDGCRDGAYRESDPVAPVSAYGRTKLAGERAVAAATANHAILRTAWVYSPFGNNFVKTMLRLAGERNELRVVADQQGNPTSALDIADAVYGITARMIADRDDTALRGIFHLSGTGTTHWAGFAAEIMRLSAELGGPAARVTPISTAEFPTPAPRPANSRLCNDKLASAYGIALPHWRDSTRDVVTRLVG